MPSEAREELLARGRIEERKLGRQEGRKEGSEIGRLQI